MTIIPFSDDKESFMALQPIQKSLYYVTTEETRTNGKCLTTNLSILLSLQSS